jgi:hypothetical protein
MEANEAVDLSKAKEILRKLEADGADEITYGALAFWIAVVKKCEKLPDDVSMVDFYAILNKSPHKAATVKVRDKVGGENDGG